MVEFSTAITPVRPLLAAESLLMKTNIFFWKRCLYWSVFCRLFKSNSHGRAFGPTCNSGDKVGCGINFSEAINDDPQRRMVPVVFTRNGSEVPSFLQSLPQLLLLSEKIE